LWLFNWSETNRSLTGVWWALALPFSLVNVAGYMGWGPVSTTGPVQESPNSDDEPDEPEVFTDESFDRGRDVVIRIVALLQGVLLTATAFVWLIAIIEAIEGHFPYDDSSPLSWSVLTVLIAGVLLGGHMVVRLARSPERSPIIRAHYRWSAVLHVALIFGLGWFLLWERPGESFNLLELSIFVGLWASIGFVAILLIRALVLLVFGDQPRAAVSAVGAAVLIVAAWGLLVGTASALRIGVEWAFSTLGPLFRANWVLEELTPWPSFLVHPEGLDNSALSVVNGMLIINTLSDVVFVGVVMVISWFLYMLRGSLEPDETGRGCWWRFVHTTIACLPWTLVPGLLAALAAWVWMIWVWWPTSVSKAGEVGSSWVVLWTLVIALVAFFFVISVGKWKPVRGFVDIVADITGFFPVQWHPLAGESYRSTVVRELNKSIDGPTVEAVILSGHSQGSVIGLWCLAHRTVKKPLWFVTSGSPIASLYVTFFPRVFTQRLVESAQEKIVGWANIWRVTDPIASKLWGVAGTEGTINDVKSLDPPSKDLSFPDVDRTRNMSKPRWHLDYWSDYRLVEETNAFVQSAVVVENAPVGADGDE
jgi:hypothetical protein